MPGESRHLSRRSPGDTTAGAFRVALSATLIVAAVLRMWGLDSSLWIDEILLVLGSVRMPLQQTLTTLRSSQHPLYSVVANATVALLGESNWALRLPACVFGVASVAMVYALGARLMSRTEAWASAALLATSYHHIWYSQSARGYTMQGFFALWATYALLRGLETGRRRDWVFYVLAVLGAIHSHLSMSFMLAGHLLLLVIARSTGWWSLAPARVGAALRAAALAAGLVAMLYAPLLLGVLRIYRTWGRSATAQQISTLSWTMGAAAVSALAGAGLPALLGGAAVGGIGVFAFFRRQFLAGALLTVPGVLLALTVFAMGRPLYPRFFFFLSGAAALFLARGLGVVAVAILPRRVRDRPAMVSAAIVAITLLVITASTPALARNYRVPKQDFDGAIRHLDRAEAGGARIAVVSACGVYGKFYGRGWPCLTTVDDFTAFAAGEPRALIAYTLPDFIRPPLRARLRGEGCPVVARFPGTLGGGTIVVCEARADAAGR
jgi:4-amino-4-deoxy-L-arabinose transferase-like glycosyltransferase